MKSLCLCFVIVVGLLAGISPVACAGSVAAAEGAQKLAERFAWRALDWAYPTEGARQQALRSGDFIPENNLPVGIEVWGDKLFVTVPRWRQGIPAALNYISLSTANTESPKLTPYPDWNTNREGNCNGITTTYRIKADACNRLWVLDTGTVGIGNTTENVCPYALLAFDLTTDKLIRRYQYKPDDTNANTFIANIAVDIGHTCDDTFVYASDELGYGLIVYSWEQNTSWRVTHSYFMPDPLKGDYNIAGLNFQWGEEGIFGMSLSPIQADGFRTLFFHPLSSHREFAVSTRVLRNREQALKSYHEFVALEERGPNTHLTASFMDDLGIMYYNLIDQNAVGCWNSKNPYLPQYQGIIDRDDVGLVFPSDVKIDAQRNIWVMSDRMPVFLEADLDFKDVNFRIYVANADQVIAGTVCDPGAQVRQSPVSHLSLHTPAPTDLAKNNLEVLSLPPVQPALPVHAFDFPLAPAPAPVSKAPAPATYFTSQQPQQQLSYVAVQTPASKLAYDQPAGLSGGYSFQTTHFGSKRSVVPGKSTSRQQVYYA
ncbi:Protein yellow [Gryllus bimaculatus]|nr:Protein yellow [Gryllus bimaculatus]